MASTPEGTTPPPIGSAGPAGASEQAPPPAAGPRTGPASGELTRQGVPVSESDGIHPGLATTAIGIDEGDLDVETPDPWVGRVLSNVYQVEQKIGEGGMGAVYLAKHIHLQKPYAIKVLSSSVAKHGQAVERLKQEAIAASSIEHDNIVDVVNFDRAEDGSVYIVMELLRGQSLHARLEHGPLEAHEALPIAWQICAALEAAHARGIVHRDLKPENVFLAKRGDIERVKVLDFGISKVKSADADGVRMTRTGQLVGTPLYMSPEQAKGEQDVDHRVDVYALGVMLYEMLVGAPPFDGRNYFELLWKHGNEPAPSMAERRRKRSAEGLPVGPEIPEALDRVVLVALAKAREDRYATMEAFGRALEQAMPDVQRVSAGSLTSIPPDARRSGPGSRPAPATVTSTPNPMSSTPTDALPMRGGSSTGAMWAGAAVLALLAIGGAAWALEGPSEPEPIPAPVASEPAPDPLPVSDHAVVGVEPVAADPGLPALVTVSFGGSPAGVEVRSEGGEILCITPCMHDLPGDAPAVLSFHRDGYLDESRTVLPSTSPVVELRLRPRRRPGEGGPGGGGPLIKTEL